MRGRTSAETARIRHLRHDEALRGRPRHVACAVRRQGRPRSGQQQPEQRLGGCRSDLRRPPLRLCDGRNADDLPAAGAGRFCFADRATLCAGARSLAPAARPRRFQRHKTRLSARLCAQQVDGHRGCIAQAPSSCPGSAAARPRRHRDGARRCLREPSGAFPSTRARRSAEVLAAPHPHLCVEAPSPGCGHGRALSGGRGRGSGGRLRGAAPGALTAPQRALLCAKARDSGPTLCALHVPQRWQKRVAVALCVGATGELPAQCASRLRSTEPSAREVSAAGRARRATSLRVESVAHDGDRVVTGQAFGVELAVLIEFGYPLQMAREPAAIGAALSPRPRPSQSLGALGRRPRRRPRSPSATCASTPAPSPSLLPRGPRGSDRLRRRRVDSGEALYRRARALRPLPKRTLARGATRARRTLAGVPVASGRGAQPRCLGALEREASARWSGGASPRGFGLTRTCCCFTARSGRRAARTPRGDSGSRPGRRCRQRRGVPRAVAPVAPGQVDATPGAPASRGAIFVDIATAYALVEEARVHGAGRAPEGVLRRRRAARATGLGRAQLAPARKATPPRRVGRRDGGKSRSAFELLFSVAVVSRMNIHAPRNPLACCQPLDPSFPAVLALH